MAWYAIYTKPRWEKKVFAGLVKNEVECYCPMQVIVKQWADRKKKVELPLIPSYVFVNIKNFEDSKIRMVDGVVNFVYWLGKPAKVKDKEIEQLKKFNNKYDNIKIENLKNIEGNQIILTEGIFKGQKATIKKVKKKRTELFIESLGLRLVVENSND